MAEQASHPCNAALHDRTGRLVGYVIPGYAGDLSQSADILLENLAAKATGALALRHLLRQIPDAARASRLSARAVARKPSATAISAAAAACQSHGRDGRLPQCDWRRRQGVLLCARARDRAGRRAGQAAGIHENVVVVGGGSLAKLGMKFQGALAHDMPILEDCLAAIAIQLGPDDGAGDPRLRLDVLGKHDVAVGGAARALYEALVLEPLRKARPAHSRCRSLRGRAAQPGDH